MKKLFNIRNKYKTFLLLIIILASFLRLYKISDHTSLYWEETALGYDAYSIFKTGKDYHGNILPIVSFPSFGDYKPSLYFYSIVPFITIFGPGELAVRLPSVIAGILAVLAVYLITKELKFSKNIRLLSAFLLTISPWHLQFSRAGFEVNLATTIYLFGIWLLLLARKKPKQIISSAIILTLSMYAYHGFRIVAPISALVIFLVYFKSFKLKHTLLALVVALTISFPIIKNINSPSVNQRLKETSHFTQSSAVETTNKLRQLSGNTLLSRIIFHRYWWWTGELVQNYLSNFSPSFLFLTGDYNPRHGTGEFGPLYHWEIISISFGLYLLIKSRSPESIEGKSKDKKIIPILLAVVPLATMLTKTNPHTLRMLPASAYFSIISAYGLSHIIKHFKKLKKFTPIIISAVIFIEFIIFAHFYTTHYPSLSAKDWQYGYKQVFNFIKSQDKKYDHIFVTRNYGRPSTYALLYLKVDPNHIQSMEPKLNKDQLELLEFDNFTFISNPPIQPNSLYVLSSKEVFISGEQIYQVDYPNGETAFLVYETQ